MATNLARQLQRLEVPGQPSLQQLASKKRPSFLFDAREAGDVDTETVFHLATNGLEELATIDETFLEFRDTLFSDTYKEFERTHTTDEEVESLNRELERFLLLVSPYFLLKPSHKCLEWLVRVFRINSFNVDHVMQCILPYYQTNLFVRMVQLLPLKSHTSRWHWLRPLQKSGSPLSQQTLINHCIADHASLVFICELVGKWVRCQKHRPNCSQTAIALYTTTLVGVIEMTKKISEDLVTLISPYLTKGLKSKNCDLYCSSLVSVSLLSSKVLLVDRLVHSFIETIAKNLKPEFEQESFLCLSYVCSSQKQRILTRKTTSHLLKYDRTVVCLESMLKSQNIIHFCELLMRSVVDVLSGDSPNDIYFRVLVDMARDFPISDVFVEELTKSLLSVYTECEVELDVDTLLCPLMRALSTRQSEAFDKAVREFLSEGGAKKEAVFNIVSMTLPGIRHQVIKSTCSTLALSLHHHDSHMRAAAVTHLKKILEKDHLEEEDKEFVQSAVLQRLKDDCREVVRAVLDISVDSLFSLVPPTELLQGLMGIVRDFKWEDCTLVCVRIASSSTAAKVVCEEDMNAFILELLPNLLLMHKNWETPLKMTTLLAESSLTTSHPLLKGLNELVLCDEYQRLREDPGAKNQLVNTNFAFLDWFTENLKLIEDNRPLISLLLGFGRGPVTKSSVCRFVFANFVLSHWIRGMQDRSLQLELSAVLVTAFNQSTPEDHKSDEKLLLPTTPFSVLAFLNKSTKSTNLRRLFAVFRLWTMNIIINSIVLPPSAGSIWLTLDAPEQEENWYHFTLLSVLDTLTSRVGNSGGGDSGDDGADGADREGGRPSNAYRTLLQNMLEVQFSGRGWLLRFLALLWTSPSSSTVTVDTMLGGPLSLCVGPILQARGLQIGAAYLSSLDVQSLVAICTTKCPLIPSLLVPLVSPLSTLRQQSIACFRSIHLVVDQLAGGLANEAHSTSPLLHLVTAIVQYSFDIASDPHYFAVVLKGLFHKGSSSESSSRSLRRERGLAAVHSQLMAAITQEGTPIAVQTVLLGNLHLVDHPVKLKESCDLLQKMLCRDQPASEDAKELLEVLIKGFTPKSATVFEEFESGFQSFLSVLGGQHQLLYSSRLQELALMQVSPLFFSSLDTSLQCQLLKAMINSLVSTDDAGMVTLIRSTLQKLPLTADHLSEELKQDFNVLGVVSEEETPRPKRRKRTKEPIYNLLSCRRRLCVVLELSTSLTDLEGGDHWRLVPLLFQLLGHVLDPEDQWEELEYPCQLILTQLTLCCKQLTAMDPAQALKVVPEDVFDVELAVKCIRVSSDTHTQHHAFMLLATAAKLYPSRILHNIMPIFTFMGTSVMRCDNQYSYSIIQQTIDSIIPALMQSPRLHRGKTPSRHTTSGGRTPQTEETIQEVLRVFVDTLPHIPPHRQQPLFIHLLNAVGVGENLHQLWLLLVYKHILLKTKEEKQAAFQYVAFACELADHFHGNSLSAILKLLQHTSSLPFERPQRQLRQARQKVTFDPASHSTRQLLHYQHSLYNLMTLLLSRPNLIQNFSESSNAEETVLQLLEGLLVAMTTQSHVSLSDTTHGKFLISVQQKTEELTQKVTNLLSLDSFLAIMKQLIEESSSLTQLKAFELLGRELQSPRESLTTSHKEQLIVMVSSVKGIAMVKSKRQLNPSTNQIAALHCLGSLSELIAEEFCNEFVDISKDLLGILSRRNVPPEVAGCSLQVISLLVAKIGVQLIPLLTQLVPAILDHVHPNENGSVLGSACGALLSVVSVLANFISPYASSIMKKVCVPAFGPTSSDIDLHLCGVLKNIRKQLGARTPLRILLPVFLSTMEDLKLLGQEEMASCLEVTEECLCGLTPSDVQTHSKPLLDLSHLLLSYRSHHPSVNELECVSFVEKRVVTILGSVVLKMSEASFRPMFLMLFDWATGEGAAKEGLIAFYHFACRMAEVLKGIFLLFAGHTLLNCAELLLQLHSDNEEKVFSEEEKNCLLLSYILQTLLKCFLFSKKQFLTKERFQTLLSPLVSQVSNCLGTTAECDRRLKEDLSPCIAEFGAAVSGRDAFWKQLNQKLLGMTRHTEPKVRVSVLTVLSELYRKLGEEFVILLPETIPYLAELLEDEVEEVEISCRHLISEIEGIVGESIQEYLSTA